MQFTKLRLTGFKSFVEPTEFLIEPGLTGIVGPNGCGKSNLVEALQWVMGETSARRLRGGEMDDVIFGGTSSRPARNIATVCLSVDNRERTAPAHLNDQDELEIERRIDRDRGSTYRVNSREQRARDVQILFADAASGAQSTALIGQGRIGWLINARPSERRTLLEEAAGIGGLQARRHEAELRLSATETNLTRLEDVAATLTAQIDRLKRQVRQAERYRGLSESYRLTEAKVLRRHLDEQTARLEDSVERLREAQSALKLAGANADAAIAERVRCAEAVQPVRAAVDEASRGLERASLDLQGVIGEARAVAQRLRDLRQRLTQTDQDLAREAAILAEAERERVRLIANQEAMDVQEIGSDAALKDVLGRVQEAADAAREADAALNLATARMAQRQAERAASQRRLAAIEERRQRLRRQQADATARSREVDLLGVPPERLHAAAAAVVEAETLLEQARALAEYAERDIRSAQTQEQAVRPVLRAAEQRTLSLNAEIQALTRLAQTASSAGARPILDDVSVQPGYEAALGAVLGDDLLAAADPRVPVHWSDLGAKALTSAPWPAGVRPLAELVSAPAPMSRRLNAIGLVADHEMGSRLHVLLTPGQRLVAVDGAVWRWDGLMIAAGAPSAAAVRLAQRNRLLELSRDRDDAERELAIALERQQEAQKSVEAAQAADRHARDSLRAATQKIATARAAEAALIQQANAADARRVAAEEALRRLSVELGEVDIQANEASLELALVPEPQVERAEIDLLRVTAEQARESERGHRREAERLRQESSARQARLAAIRAEINGWVSRANGAAAHHAILGERRWELAHDLEELNTQPPALEESRQALEAQITILKGVAASAAKALADAEAVAAAAERRQIDAAQRLGDAREAAVRADSAHQQAAEARARVLARIAESDDTVIDTSLMVDGDDASESLVMMEARLERLKRERDAIGPVNLMAESELSELTAEFDTNRAESADLRAAIARLRQGIQELNRESRGRLLAAFEVVNTNFKALFVQLFGGGAAHLELVNHENDPLQAGLEIMASPPGKKLQMLSLLSGGERALTAVALVFAMFLTNPAPICVLDEVDAPLDDANVERFCHLVRDIGERTRTRFLIVTHHRVTMAKMDRLYGVTMIEKGVSRLVSVDLGETDRLRRAG